MKTKIFALIAILLAAAGCNKEEELVIWDFATYDVSIVK
jgi:hypothetical protein